MRHGLGRLLVVVAHGDDEVLGCGGTVARAVRKGWVVRTVVMTDGDSSRGSTDRQPVDRRPSIAAAHRVLGTSELVVHDFPDNRLVQVDAVTLNTAVAAEMSGFRPDLVITHSSADLSCDHRRVNEAVLVAARPHVDRRACSILGMEVRSATDTGEASGRSGFSPSIWVELTEADLATKMAALECYGSELRAWPHPRSREGVSVLVRYRGSQVALEACESFESLRLVLAEPCRVDI